MVKWDFPDLAAARALVMTGLTLRKMLGGTKGKLAGAGQDDLFDAAQADDGNWSFPEPKDAV